MKQNINDIIQKHISQRSCGDDTELMQYTIKGPGPDIFHCKYIKDCKYKKREGILTYCVYFNDLTEDIRKNYDNKI